MDIRKPRYSLKTIKAMLRQDSTRTVTESAIDGATALGYLTVEAMLEVIDKLDGTHLFKSMTCTSNSQLWQDVYKVKDGDKKLYIKLQMSPDGAQGVLVQFKEDDG